MVKKIKSYHKEEETKIREDRQGGKSLFITEKPQNHRIISTIYGALNST